MHLDCDKYKNNPESRKELLEIMEIFDDLYDKGNTIILVTHEPYIAEKAHRIIRLRDGLVEVDEMNKAFVGHK